MDKKPKRTTDRLRVSLWLFFLGSISIFLWAGTFYLMKKGTMVTPPVGYKPPDMGSEANLLFGASSMALIMFSIVIGLLTLFGWEGIKNAAKRDIEASTEERFGELDRELRGRALAVMGAMAGDAHSDPTLAVQTETNKAYLHDAVIALQKAYDLLKSVKGMGRFMALNNLVYYSCLLDEGINRRLILEQARMLKEVRNESHANPYLLTYCRAVGQYASAPKEREEALEILQEDLLQRELTPIEKQEAKRCLALLKNKLPQHPRVK